MTTVDWYFDFVSPYAYLASENLNLIQGDVEIIPHPVLFAGILKKWDTRGPAEIGSMRKFTYRQIAWLAERNHTTLNFPPQHPFNPLKLLRLQIALGGGLELTQALFRFVWSEGRSVEDLESWHYLLDQLEINPQKIEEQITSKAVKQGLIDNTQSCLELGLFGVPAFVVDKEIFWGFDSIAFLNDYLKDPALFRHANMRQADGVGEGVKRR